MKGNSKYRKPIGLFSIVLSSTLWGQVPAANLGNHETPIPTVATPAESLPSSSPDRPEDSSFVIGNNDVLAINVWKEPELTRSIPVRSDGKISLPLMGEVQAAGRTPSQLEQEIVAKLENYIAKPKVTVIVEQVNSKKVNILGQVAKPGSYSIALAPTVVDAIATAGGLLDFAKPKAIYILRPNRSGGESRITFNYKEFIKGRNLDQNIKLVSRDTIIVP